MDMDKKLVFVKTDKGEAESGNKTGNLSGDLKRAMFLIDGKSTFEELSKRAAPSLREVLDGVLTELATGGYIRDKAKPFAEPQIITPKNIVPASDGELDFTAEPDIAALKQPSPVVGADDKAAEAARARAELEAAVEAAKAKARAEAEAKAEANARLLAESAARNKVEAELRSKQEALVREQAEVKAKQEAEARMRAEQVAAQAKLQLEAAAKAKAEAEAQARQQIEAAARARAEAEARAKQEAEAARLKAEQEAARIRAELEAAAKAKAEAEAARLKAEQEAARIRAELEAAKAKAEAEAKALAEQRAKQEAEAAQLRAEQEAVRIKAEQEAARVRAEAEVRAKQEAEAARLKAEQAAAQALSDERARQEVEAARLRAEQDAAEARAVAEGRARQEAEAARVQAEQESKRAKDELAAVKAAAAHAQPASDNSAAEETHSKAEQARRDAEAAAATLKANQEGQRLAEEQAKTWAAAEQRAKEQARIEAERPVQTAAEPVKPVSQKRGNVRRKPLPLGKIAVGLMFAALLAIVLLPYVMPLDGYVGPLEQRLAAQFKQPVHVGSLHASSLPWPRLQMEKVSLGNGQELSVEKVDVTFDLLSLFADIKTIRSVELKDVTLSVGMLDKELAWLRAIGVSSAYPVKHVTVSRAKIAGAEISFPMFNGEVDIGEHGAVGKIALTSTNAKFDIELQPVQDRWQIELSVKESALPLLSNVSFDDLNAKGELSATGIDLVEIKAQAYGGFLQGKAKLNWRQGWSLQGEFDARTLELAKLFPKFGVSGEVAGNARFSAVAAKPDKLDALKQMDGTFTVSKGVINGMDMVETARQTNHQNASGGRTHIDELRGVFQANAHGSHFQQLKISSGILSGNGAFDVNAEGQLAGRFAVDLKARSGTSSLVLSGTLTEPILRSGR
jgi:hypothetical protein